MPIDRYQGFFSLLALNLFYILLLISPIWLVWTAVTAKERTLKIILLTWIGLLLLTVFGFGISEYYYRKQMGKNYENPAKLLYNYVPDGKEQLPFQRR